MKGEGISTLPCPSPGISYNAVFRKLSSLDEAEGNASFQHSGDLAETTNIQSYNRLSMSKRLFKREFFVKRK